MENKKPKGTFAKLMASPLPQQQQSPFEKANMGQEETSLPADPQTSKETNQQNSKLANQFTDLPINQQTNKQGNQLSTKEKRKYTTYLTDESILAIQMKGIQTKRKDHEIVQEAIDRYFEKE